MEVRTIAINVSEKMTIGITLGLLIAIIVGIYTAGWQLRGYAEKIAENSAALELNTQAVNAQISQVVRTQSQDQDRLRLLENAVLVLTTESNVRNGRQTYESLGNK